MRTSTRAVALTVALAVGTSVSEAQAAGAAKKPAPGAMAKRGEASFEKGDKIFSAGVLLGGGGYGGIGGTGLGAGVQLEVGVVDFTPKIRLGVGGLLGYTRRSQSSVKLSAIPVYAIGNVHFEMPDYPDLDLYAGLSVGFTRFSVKSDVTFVDKIVPAGTQAPSLNVVTRSSSAAISNSSTGTGVGVQGGIRYSLGKSFTLQGQLGLGDIPLFFGGVSFKF
jgi:hypothetical protein